MITSDATSASGASAPTKSAGGADSSSRVLHRKLGAGMPMATRAEGNYLYTADGAKILDASGGAAVVSVGHGVPEIIDAVCKQVGTLPYVSSAVFGIEPAEELAKKMCEEAGMARAIFQSGGSESVESAIKVSATEGCGLMEALQAVPCGERAAGAGQLYLARDLVPRQHVGW